MSDISLPSIAGLVQSFAWRVIAPSQMFRSPFDGTVQTGDAQGPRWGASIRLRDDMDVDEAQDLLGFLLGLRGMVNRALIPNLSRLTPRGTIQTSGVTVNGALAAGATQLSLSGCGAAGTLVTGDCFKIGDQLLMVIDGPYTADGSGEMANVVFEHPLRAAVLDNAAVTLSSPTCRMLLMNGDAGWMVAPGGYFGMTLEFEEALV